VRQWIAARTITYYYYYTHQNFPDALKFDGIISGLVKDYLRGGGEPEVTVNPRYRMPCLPGQTANEKSWLHPCKMPQQCKIRNVVKKNTQPKK